VDPDVSLTDALVGRGSRTSADISEGCGGLCDDIHEAESPAEQGPSAMQLKWLVG